MAMAANLRDFHREDLFETVHLANRVLDEAYSPELFLRIAELYPEGFVVAEDGEGTIVGFVMGVVSVPNVARVLVLVVDPDHQRRGIGGALLGAFATRFEQAGVDRLRLEVRKSNDGAIRFYRRHGFEVEGVLQGHYRDGEDAFVMVRPVEGGSPEKADADTAEEPEEA